MKMTMTSVLSCALALAASACVAVAERAGSVVARLARFVCSLVLDLAAQPVKLSLPRPGLLDLRTPALLTAARSFAQRLLRRQYAHVDERWRMCPSV